MGRGTCVPVKIIARLGPETVMAELMAGAVPWGVRGAAPSEICAPPPVVPKKFKIRPSLAKILRKLALR